MTSANVTAIAPGVQLCAIRAGRFKTSRLLLQLALPLRLGQPAVTAANAALPFLLHRSCAAYPRPRMLESRLAELYGAKLSAQVHKQGEAQVLTIALTAIDDRFALAGEAVAEGCANLLLDLLFEPNLEDGLFPERSVALEKRLLAEQLESEEGNKWTYASNRCDALMCSQEAYGLNPKGEKGAVAALTPEDVTGAWRGALEAAPIQFTLVAGSDGEAVREAIAARFAGQARNPVTPETEFVFAAGEEKFVREEQPIEQAKLFIGLRAGMKDHLDHTFATEIMTDLFGGGPHSKLFLNVREKMSLCYAVGARFSERKGIVTVRAGVDTEKVPEAKAEILRQLQLMKDGDFTDEELATSIRSMCNEIRNGDDTPERVAGWYGIYGMGRYTGALLSREEWCARAQAVTRDEVVAAANGLTLDTIYLLASKNEEKEGGAKVRNN
ncbi:MAG: insulinase family protein [Oscillospiraceae bacterium]|jgi:predicted Zn-dependent peptidase|nr:insulinase family protein [Oscillospiraceae bacterium]